MGEIFTDRSSDTGSIPVISIQILEISWMDSWGVDLVNAKGCYYVPKPLEIGYTDDIPQIIAEGVVVEKPTYKSLDWGRINDKKNVLVSTEEALKDAIPIEWDADALNRNKRVVLVEQNNRL